MPVAPDDNFGNCEKSLVPIIAPIKSSILAAVGGTLEPLPVEPEPLDEEPDPLDEPPELPVLPEPPDVDDVEPELLDEPVPVVPPVLPLDPEVELDELPDDEPDAEVEPPALPVEEPPEPLPDDEEVVPEPPEPLAGFDVPVCAGVVIFRCQLVPSHCEETFIWLSACITYQMGRYSVGCFEAGSTATIPFDVSTIFPSIEILTVPDCEDAGLSVSFTELGTVKFMTPFFQVFVMPASARA
jgi:hypothetical protein